jgi:ubiquinone/menaquinone biosynthesis C-methylase UbiE
MTKFFNNFWKKRSLINDPDISSHYKKDETINYDIKFIKKYLKPNFTVLDLGCGPMRTVSKIYKSCKHIDCVDFQSKYVEMHKKYKNTKGFVKPVRNFTIDKKKKKMYSNKFKTRIFSNIYPKKLNKFINTKTFFFKLTNN